MYHISSAISWTTAVCRNFITKNFFKKLQLQDVGELYPPEVDPMLQHSYNIRPDTTTKVPKSHFSLTLVFP